MNQKQVTTRWINMVLGNEPFKELSASHFFIADKIIYSYGRHFPIVNYLPEFNTFLMTTDTYSNSTAKHLFVVRNELLNVRPKLSIYHVPMIKPESNNDHILNLTYLKETYHKQVAKFLRCRVKNTPEESLSNMVRTVTMLSSTYSDFAALFNLTPEPLSLEADILGLNMRWHKFNVSLALRRILTLDQSTNDNPDTKMVADLELA